MTDGSGTALGQTALPGTFAVERDLAASPDMVFAAYADDGTQDIARLKGSMNSQPNALAAALATSG